MQILIKKAFEKKLSTAIKRYLALLKNLNCNYSHFFKNTFKNFNLKIFKFAFENSKL